MDFLHSEYLTNPNIRLAREHETRQELTAELFEEWRVLGVVNGGSPTRRSPTTTVVPTDARCLDIIERLGGVTAGAGSRVRAASARVR